MTFRAAFQKEGAAFCKRLIRWWDNGKYYHCELVFSDGKWGSSINKYGVTLRHRIHIDSDWDYVDLPDELEHAARIWFENHKGQPYDYVGVLRFILNFLNPARDKWFCSRACADALGLENGWLASPNKLYTAIKDLR